MAKKKATTRKATEDLDELSFEQAVERVEAIIERIESGEAGLEQSIAEYERGVGLLKRCREILENAEQRIEKLAADGTAQPDDSPDAGD